MLVQAKAKFIQMSPRKVRLLIDMIRGMKALDARAQLELSPKAAATPVLKALNSAIANAVHNNSLKIEDLKVEKAFVDEGPTLKRFKPRAHGKAAPIRKRMSHITIVVGDGKDEQVVVKKETVKKVDSVKIEEKKNKKLESTSKK